VKSLATTSHAVLRLPAIGTSNTGPQQLVQQSSSSSGSSTHETEDVSNHSHGTHPDGIFYPLIWVDPVAPADPSLSPSYASRSATESPQYDWRPLIPTTTFSTSDVYAQRPNSPNYHDYHDITNPILPLSTQYEVSRSQSNIPARMASNYYTPYDTTNQEANTSDPRSPHGGWDSYHASSDNQVPSARSDHPRCLICFIVNCETHPECIC